MWISIACLWIQKPLYLYISSAKIQEERDQKFGSRRKETNASNEEPRAPRYVDYSMWIVDKLSSPVLLSPSKSPVKKKRPPPGSPKKLVTGVRRKGSENKTAEKHRMEEQDQEPDSGYKSPPKYDKDEVVRKMEEDDDDKIEEMIDDISTNEMFGSSILSMEN